MRWILAGEWPMARNHLPRISESFWTPSRMHLVNWCSDRKISFDGICCARFWISSSYWQRNFALRSKFCWNSLQIRFDHHWATVCFPFFKNQIDEWNLWLEFWRFCGNDVPTRQIKSLTNRAIILMRAPASPSERAKHQIYSGAKGFKLRFKSDEASTEKEEPFVPVNEANAAQYINEPPNSNCCRDSDSLCCSWALSGKCDSDASVKLKCRKACGICGCKSKNKNCFIRSEKIFCFFFLSRKMWSENQFNMHWGQ